MASKGNRLKSYLEQEAHALGFDGIGIADPGADDLPARLQEFCRHHYHGSMAWMTDTQERRSDPKKLWSEVRSIAMVCVNYGPEFDPLANLENRESGTISVYARNRDYHEVMKGRLKTLASKLVSRARSMDMTGDVKVFVDTAPVMEKPLAARAGLGWQGKHTNLVSREFGSWLFLGALFTTYDLPLTEPEHDHCGSCHSCLDICPTDAFPAPYKLDARRCISYLTIENKGPIPIEFREAIGNRIFGCDDCLAVCPWNKFASQTREAKLSTKQPPPSNQLSDLLNLDDAMFRERFSGSPVKRIGRERFIRNCLIAAGNSSRPELCPVVEALIEDDAPIVRGAAVWALSRLHPQRLAQLSELRKAENDEQVLREWEIANG